jgi:hypothetical protein
MKTQHGGVSNAAVLVMTCGLFTLEQACIILKTALHLRSGMTHKVSSAEPYLGKTYGNVICYCL